MSWVIDVRTAGCWFPINWGAIGAEEGAGVEETEEGARVAMGDPGWYGRLPLPPGRAGSLVPGL